MFGINFSLFGGNDDSGGGVQALAEIIAERQRTLNLYAEYGEPQADLAGEPTATFPYTVYQDGAVYRIGAKEFPIPDDGEINEDSALGQFLASHGGTASVEALESVQGTTVDADLAESGEIELEAAV